jgi:flagellar assembly protein FliH
VTRGKIEDVAPRGESVVRDDRIARSALDMAEEEVKKLRDELRVRETELTQSREECKTLKDRMETDRANLERERREFLENAERDAAVLEESSRVKGFEEGHSEGYSQGLIEAEDEMKKEYEGKFLHALSLLEEMVKSLETSRERLAERHAPQLIRLWETMLRKMLSSAVDLDPGAASRIVENMLKRLSDRERIMVYLNPSDVAMIEENKESLMDSIRGVKFFELLSDDHVDKGSCLIETNLGIYDARWRTQLEQVSSEVQNLLMEFMASDVSNA